MFKWIWEREEHVSRISGYPLHPQGHSHWHWQFAHVLPKGLYGKWRLNPNNIWLMLPDEHTSYDHRGVEGKKEFENLLIFREEMQLFYNHHVY